MKCQILLILLLIPLLLLNACNADTKLPQNTDTQTTTQNTSPEEKEPTATQSILGIWYSLTDRCVLDIHDSENVTYYQLKPGYYEYESKTQLSATYLDYILKISPTEGTTLSWIFDAKNGTLTSSDSNVAYTREEALPAEYIKYDFPDFPSMDCESMVTLGEYQKITLSPEELTAKSAQSVFSKFYANSTSLPMVEGRATQQGDYVNIDFEGFLNDVAFSGGTATDQTILLIEDSGYIPGFAEQIVGHTVGEQFDIAVTFPENYGSTELAGQDAIFKITLNAIYDMKISDGEIKTYTNNEYQTYADFLNYYYESYQKQSVWSDVLENATPNTLPESTYHFFLQWYHDDLHYTAYQYGMDYEMVLMLMGYSEDSLVYNAKISALSYVAAHAIAKQNNLQITDDMFNAETEELIANFIENNDCSREAAEAYVESQKEIIKAELLYDTVTDWLVTRAEQNTAEGDNNVAPAV